MDACTILLRMTGQSGKAALGKTQVSFQPPFQVFCLELSPSFLQEGHLELMDQTALGFETWISL